MPSLSAVRSAEVAGLRRLVHLEGADAAVSPRQLLADAAYFADSAMADPGIRPRQSVIQRHTQFLSAAILREIVGDSFRPDSA